MAYRGYGGGHAGRFAGNFPNQPMGGYGAPDRIIIAEPWNIIGPGFTGPYGTGYGAGGFATGYGGYVGAAGAGAAGIGAAGGLDGVLGIGVQNYAGRGPRNYRRADDRIEDDINDRLTAHPWIDATDIEVDVADGVVSLTGTVNSRDAKYAAEELSETVYGVDEVENLLRVQPAGQQGAGRPAEGQHGEERQGAGQEASRGTPRAKNPQRGTERQGSRQQGSVTRQRTATGR
ncbi:MAG TPA: BON domain-containing protein [Gemmatimonadaceae bacterium]